MVTFTLRPVYRRCKGPHPYVRIGLDAFGIVNQLELQTSDHEMIPAWGGNGVEVSGALMGLLYIRGIIGLLLMGKKGKVYFRIDPEGPEGSRDIAVRFL